MKQPTADAMPPTTPVTSATVSALALQSTADHEARCRAGAERQEADQQRDMPRRDLITGTTGRARRWRGARNAAMRGGCAGSRMNSSASQHAKDAMPRIAPDIHGGGRLREPQFRRPPGRRRPGCRPGYLLSSRGRFCRAACRTRAGLARHREKGRRSSTAWAIAVQPPATRVAGSAEIAQMLERAHRACDDVPTLGRERGVGDRRPQEFPRHAARSSPRPAPRSSSTPRDLACASRKPIATDRSRSPRRTDARRGT